MLAENQRADPEMCGVAKLLTGAAQRRALEPRDVELQPAGENSTGGSGLK